MAVAGAIWTVTLLLSRAIGVVREAVLGATLGMSSAADVYAAAFRVPDLFAYVVSGGALSILFIPMFTGHLQAGNPDRAWRAFSVVANFLTLLLAVVTPLAWWAMPMLAPRLAPGFSPEDTALLVTLSRIVLPAQVFHILGGLLSAVLLARDRHALPAVAPLVYTLCIVFGGWLSGTAEGFAWGVLAGAAIGPFGVPLYGVLRSPDVRWTPVVSWRDPDLRTYLLRSLPIMLGFSIVSVDDTAWTAFASRLGEGEVAMLNYAKTLMKVPMGVFGMAMGYAAYPTLARLVAEGRPAEARETLAVATRRALLLAFASQVALTTAGPELAVLVLGTARIPVARMDELGVCLGLFSLGLGGWTAQTLLARGFYARGRTWLPTWLGFAVLVAALPFYALLGHRFGTPGLAAASSLAIVTYTLLLGWRSDVEFRRAIAGAGGDTPPATPSPSALGGFLLRAVPATAVGIAAGLAARSMLPPLDGTRLQALGRIAVLAVAAGPAWFVAAWTLRVPDLDAVVGMVLRRLPRRASRPA